MHQSDVLDNLRARIAHIEGAGARHSSVPFGLAQLDDWLRGSGIATGALYEIAGGSDLADGACATFQSRCFPDDLIEMTRTTELWVKRAAADAGAQRA